MKKHKSGATDIESFNSNILCLDLDDIKVDAMEQRVELALASIFDGDVWSGPPGGPGQPCDQFSCNSYWPAT